MIKELKYFLYAATIIGFICKGCYSDDILRRDLKELERESGILDIDEDLEE